MHHNFSSNFAHRQRWNNVQCVNERNVFAFPNIGIEPAHFGYMVYAVTNRQRFVSTQTGAISIVHGTRQIKL